MNVEVSEKIKSRGYWQVVIRPTIYSADRIRTLPACEEMVTTNRVRYRGWDFPYVNAGDMGRGFNYIEMAVTIGSISEAWRFHQSGQFAFLRGLTEDWIQEEVGLFQEQGPNIEPGANLSILSALYHVSEVYEFATRLAQAGIFDDRVFLSVKLLRAEGRKLFFWSGDRILSRKYVCKVRELPKEQTFDVADLIARSREYSLEHFLWLMERFGFDASPDVFKRDQEGFFQGRF